MPVSHQPNRTAERTRKPVNPKQPLEILNVPGALLMRDTVRALTGLGMTKLQELIAAGNFPKPVKLGPRCTRWRSDEVRTWLAQQTNQAEA